VGCGEPQAGHRFLILPKRAPCLRGESHYLTKEFCMKYLITGATGFLGRHLIAQLREAGHEVVALCRDDAPELRAVGVEIARGDILQKSSIKAAAQGCDGMFHLAGKVSRKKEDAEVLYQLHVDGTDNALRAAKEAGVKRVVYASTSGVVAISEDAKTITNEDDDTPIGIISKFPYYRSKLFAEERALELSKELPLEVVVLNPTLILGPGDVYGSSTGDIEKILERKIPAVPAGGLSFVDVRDTATAFILAMQKGQSGRRYLLGSCNITMRTFVGRVSRLADLDVPLVNLPRNKFFSSTLVELAGFVQKHIDTDELDPVSLDMSRYYWYLDSTRAETELGWSPRDPLETLADTVEDIYPHVQKPTYPSAPTRARQLVGDALLKLQAKLARQRDR
jgi:dihydroflavonol-4-reductase